MDACYVSVANNDAFLQKYESVFKEPKCEATLISLANYTLNNNQLSAKQIIERIQENTQNFKYVFIDSGGYQSKSGKLNQTNYKRHIKIYFNVLDLLPENWFIFSLDFPPDMHKSSIGITPDLSGKLTFETYSEIAKNYKQLKDRLIIVTHFASTAIFWNWFKIFDALKQDLVDFEYFATGMLTKNFRNPSIMPYYYGAKLFLKLHGIKPKKFHFLGTSSLNLLYPLFQDTEIEFKTFDAVIHTYTGQISTYYKNNTGKYIFDYLSVKKDSKFQLYAFIKELETHLQDVNLKNTIEQLLNNLNKRLPTELVELLTIIQLHVNLQKAKLLVANKVQKPKLDYNENLAEKYLNEIKTPEQLYKLMKYFDAIM